MNSTMDLIIALLLVALGLWLMAWLLFSFLQPFLGFLPLKKGKATNSGLSLGSKKGFSERWQFRRCSKVLSEIEKALAADNIATAKKLLPKALYFEWIEHSPELIAKGSHHQLELLNKLIVIAELESASLRNLPKLEALFSNRAEVLANALETRVSKARFQHKQREKGKQVPQWSTKEFDDKLQNLRTELESLHQQALVELQEAVKQLSRQAPLNEPENKYH